MIIFKLPLLTCAFYIALTCLLEAGLWAVARFKGIGIWFSGEHWFWTLGAKLGLFLGALWVVSFIAAWCIVYAGVKAHIPAVSSETYLF
ncbi:MAG TPA: hypothetical protein VEJ38_01260 [Candidatus Acidoferrales bacterium]|nr:hypothetical protein [Candidatus Acidoferrales bacterium]